MDRDDAQVGRLLSRREILALLGASGIAALAGCKPSREVSQVGVAGSRAMPSCIVRPEQTEGPYFVDGRLDRSDIRSEPGSGAIKAGTPLQLALVVSRIGAGGACAPIAGARVDLWQCNAAGVYSGVRDPSFDTSGQQFLRGYQMTDATGTARFTTIYPDGTGAERFTRTSRFARSRRPRAATNSRHSSTSMTRSRIARTHASPTRPWALARYATRPMAFFVGMAIS